MFKELGALIDAAGEVVAKSMKISAKAVKEALSDKDDNDEPTMGDILPPHVELELGDVINISKGKDEIIIKEDEVDKDEDAKF